MGHAKYGSGGGAPKSNKITEQYQNVLPIAKVRMSTARALSVARKSRTIDLYIAIVAVLG